MASVLAFPLSTFYAAVWSKQPENFDNPSHPRKDICFSYPVLNPFTYIERTVTLYGERSLVFHVEAQVCLTVLLQTAFVAAEGLIGAFQILF